MKPFLPILLKLSLGMSAGDLYTLGLFHDCGIPAFANKFYDTDKAFNLASQLTPLIYIHIRNVE